MPYRLIEHTADLGIEITAGSLNELFEEAARAMFNEIVEDLSKVEHRVEKVLSLEESTLEDLLVSWLSELLYIFDVEEVVFSKFEVSIEGTALKGRAYGEYIDRSRHVLRTEIKSVTYHMLSIERTDGSYKATVIFDI